MQIMVSIFTSINLIYNTVGASQVGVVVKNLPANAGDVKDVGLIPGLGRCSGEGNGNLFSMLAWRIPWTEEPGEL